MPWSQILNYAIQAPSPHNVQPWKIRLRNDSEAELFIDSTRTLPKEDLTGSFIILTMGMFIEAIDILARPLGYRLSSEISNDLDALAQETLADKGQRLIHFATLRLSISEPDTTEYSPDLFLKRRTSRVSLRPDSVPASVLKRLTDLASGWKQDFCVTTDAAVVERLLKLNTQALFSDLNSTDYHDEITEWFRFSDAQALEHLDGLDHRCMNTSKPVFWMSAKMPWLTKAPLLRGILGSIYRSQLGTIPTLGFISGGFWKPEDAYEAGRFLMRFWLELAKHDLYIHPFGNLVTNRPIAAQVERETDLENLWLVFKIGYSPEPPKSHRLPLESVLVN
jgi:hypothetical protein